MSTYRIKHLLSDDLRITTCNNDLEFIKFVNRLQEENDHELTFDVESAIDYINLGCDDVDFEDEDEDEEREEEYSFTIDEKHTIWYRGTIIIYAKSHSLALEQIHDKIKNDELITDDWGTLYETIGNLTVEENHGNATIEITDETDGHGVYKNGN
jgi:hypothetical protein